MNVETQNKFQTVLTVLLWFNAISAMTGGLAVATSSLSLPASWLDNSIFTSYLVPGLILMLVVGGSSLWGALSATLNRNKWSYASGIAGIIMVGWIAGEVTIINQFSWLQIIYLLSGAALVLGSWGMLKSRSVRESKAS